MANFEAFCLNFSYSTNFEIGKSVLLDRDLTIVTILIKSSPKNVRTKVAAFSRLEFLCNQEKSDSFLKKGKADKRSKHAFHHFLK